MGLPGEASSVSEHKTIVGVCEKVEAPPGGDGFHSYHIRHAGSQYPLKLVTKKPELVALANAVGGQMAEWGYLESQGNPNPHKPGSFYMNRYLDSAVVVNATAAMEAAVDGGLAETPQAPHPAGSADAPPPPVDWDAKDLRKHRQAAYAIAVSRAAQAPAPWEVDVAALAESIVQFTYRKVEYQPAEALADLGADGLEDIPF